MARNDERDASASIGSAMAFGDHPALLINPKADPGDILAWARAEAENLHELLEIMACSHADIEMDPCRLAATVDARLQPVINAMAIAFDVLNAAGALWSARKQTRIRVPPPPARESATVVPISGPAARLAEVPSRGRGALHD